MPARPPRKCSIVGDGIVTFGVRVVWLFRYWKSASWMSLTCRTLSITRITGGASSSLPSGLRMVTGMSVLTPPSCSRKSMWKYVRRNSPSVIDCRPASSCIFTTSVIARSSTLRSSAGEISSRANFVPRVEQVAAGAGSCRRGRRGREVSCAGSWGSSLASVRSAIARAGLRFNQIAARMSRRGGRRRASGRRERGPGRRLDHRDRGLRERRRRAAARR